MLVVRKGKIEESKIATAIKCSSNYDSVEGEHSYMGC